MDPPIVTFPSLASISGEIPVEPQGDPLMMADLRRTAIQHVQPLSAASGPGPGSFHRVDVRHASELSYSEFVRCYMSPNKPVLIQGAMEHWRARKEWVCGDGSPNVAALECVVGPGSMVCVTDTRQQQGGCGEVKEMSLGEFIEWWWARPGVLQNNCCQQDLQPLAHEQQQQQQQTKSRQQPEQEWQYIHAQHQQQENGQQGQGLLLQGCNSRPEHVPHYYLKDWHFCSVAPLNYKAYQLPTYFSSDWLNAYYDDQSNTSSSAQGAAEQQPATASGTSTADYRFVYLGPAGSWTPLHADVLRSYSWSANVAGVKRWLLLPPEHTHMLYDRNYTQLAPDFGVDDVESTSASAAAVKTLPVAELASTCTPSATPSPTSGTGAAAASVPAALQQVQRAVPVQRPFLGDPKLAGVFPWLKQAHQHLFECIQGPGDILFVPSGMHHTVTNVTDTLSINHNWINAFNVHWTLALLRALRKKAEAAIEDCRALCSSCCEFQALVDRNLAADSGMDLRGFAHFVAVAAVNELAALEKLNEDRCNEGGFKSYAQQDFDQALSKCKLQGLKGSSSENDSSKDEHMRAWAWHKFSLKRACLVMEAVVVEARAACKGADLCDLSELTSAMNLRELVHNLKDKDIHGHFHYVPYFSELLHRVEARLNEL